MSATVHLLSAAQLTPVAAEDRGTPEISFSELISALIRQDGHAPSLEAPSDGVALKTSKADTCGPEGKRTDRDADRDDADTNPSLLACTVVCDTTLPATYWAINNDTGLRTTFKCEPPESTDATLSGHSSRKTTLYPGELRFEAPCARMPITPVVVGALPNIASRSDTLPRFPDTSGPVAVSQENPETRVPAEPLDGRSALAGTDAATIGETHNEYAGTGESEAELMLAVPSDWREHVEVATITREWTNQRTGIGSSIAESHKAKHVDSGNAVDSGAGAGQLSQVSHHTRMSVLAAPKSQPDSGRSVRKMYATGNRSHGAVLRNGPTDQIKVGNSETADIPGDMRDARQSGEFDRDIPEVGAQIAPSEKSIGAPKQAKTAIAVESDANTSHEKLADSHPLRGVPNEHPQSTSEVRRTPAPDAVQPVFDVAARGVQPDVHDKETRSSRHLGGRPEGNASSSLPDMSERQPANFVNSTPRPDFGLAKTEVHITLRTPELGRVDLRASAVDADIKAALTVESGELRHVLVSDEAGLGSICAKHDIDPSNITISASGERDWSGAGGGGTHRDRQNDAPAQRSLLKDNVSALVEEEVLDTSTGSGLNIRA